MKRQNKDRSFNPTQIIFAATSKCNLKCPHCYVSRNTNQLELQDAIDFIKSCKDSSIKYIGFSGGEPFLYIDFMEEICKTTIESDLLFDRIMTNGCWWNSEDELEQKLNIIYKTGYDGKIGLSHDFYHNQPAEKIAVFCKKVYSIWQDGSMIEIQSVVSSDKIPEDMESFKTLAQELNCNIKINTNKKSGTGLIILENEEIFLPIRRTPQTFPATSPDGWKSKKWFKEDYCEGPGNILYIHSNGNIAPCCGFANENPALIIGSIKESFSQIMENAKNNPMINLCYNQGLSSFRKKAKKDGIKFPGKTADNCTFCDFVASILSENPEV